MYNVGIVSTSYIGEEFIAAVNLNENINVNAVYSRGEITGQEFAKKNNIELVYTSYDDMLNNPDIHIIYISSPNSLHFSQALEAIRSGKHVIVEKPITLYKDELKLLYKEADSRGLLVMEAIVNIHYDNFKLVSNWLKDIGDIHYASFNLQKQTRHFMNYKKGLKINIFSKEMGGGALRDLGPYPIYPLVYFFGNPDNIKYSAIKNEEGIDETTSLLCSYENMNANISVSKLVTDTRSNVILGTLGYIEISNINLFDNIKLYDINGNIIKEVANGNNIRMKEEVDYFVDKLLSNDSIDNAFKENSLIVCSIIEDNYN